MTDPLLYVLLTIVPLAAMAALGPRLGRSTTAALVTWRTWHGVALWLLVGVVALGAELGGQALGWWDWQEPWMPLVHAWWWWASMVAVGLFRLRPLGAARWFLAQLLVTLAFEVTQQATLGWVTHASLLGSPYVAIVAIHVVVTALVVALVPVAALRAGLLRRSWGS